MYLTGSLYKLSSGTHWLWVMLSRAQGAVAPMAAAPIASSLGGIGMGSPGHVTANGPTTAAELASFGGAAFCGTTTGTAGGRAL
jgi:hypothetical protein